MPFTDIEDGLLVMRDGSLVGGICVAPFNLELKSKSEKRAIISALNQAYVTIDQPWSIMSTFRPVDLDPYLAGLDAKMTEVQGMRKHILRETTNQVRRKVRSGENTERRFYLLISRKGPDARADHRTALPTLAQDLERAKGMQTRVMDNGDWRELLFLFFHAGQAAVESIPDGQERFAPLYLDDDTQSEVAEA
ncbi:MAG: hypothetical protein M0Z41_13790 [Peptococcaceae bacterium]|nr:hypothetical protein [Peptococcaceae bacterium]